MHYLYHRSLSQRVLKSSAFDRLILGGAFADAGNTGIISSILHVAGVISTTHSWAQRYVDNSLYGRTIEINHL